MAKEAPKKEEAPAPVPAGKSNMKKIIVMVLILVLVLAVAGVGAVLMLKKKSKAADGEEATAEQTHEAAAFDPHKPPVFVAMEPFTVNLQPENGEQFLQVVATLRVQNDKIGEEVKVFMPQVRHEVLSLLSGKKASEVTTPDGRKELAKDIRDIVNNVLGWTPPKKKKKSVDDGEAGDDGAPVVGVFFTQFIVQ
ncbi:flagellar basal body-associated FliL family protein [Uliginosibacterium gangwonense]|uniref:flagellar basal body-associated FliL family protein n=1 Tax=Uliginosibacterium gangwonense TaxID=392736 RepID=UPI000367C902|nr:flagellar basal body-associated FliL family protein [Uliginosibacterium gangwonense]